jgi:hypothetical protein
MNSYQGPTLYRKAAVSASCAAGAHHSEKAQIRVRLIEESDIVFRCFGQRLTHRVREWHVARGLARGGLN